jgi:hypothetical protein
VNRINNFNSTNENSLFLEREFEKIINEKTVSLAPLTKMRLMIHFPEEEEDDDDKEEIDVAHEPESRDLMQNSIISRSRESKRLMTNMKCSGLDVY